MCRKNQCNLPTKETPNDSDSTAKDTEPIEEKHQLEAEASAEAPKKEESSKETEEETAPTENIFESWQAQVDTLLSEVAEIGPEWKGSEEQKSYLRALYYLRQENLLDFQAFAQRYGFFQALGFFLPSRIRIPEALLIASAEVELWPTQTQEAETPDKDADVPAYMILYTLFDDGIEPPPSQDPYYLHNRILEGLHIYWEEKKAAETAPEAPAADILPTEMQEAATPEKAEAPATEIAPTETQEAAPAEKAADIPATEIAPTETQEAAPADKAAETPVKTSFVEDDDDTSDDSSEWYDAPAYIPEDDDSDDDDSEFIDAPAYIPEDDNSDDSQFVDAPAYIYSSEHI